MRSSELSLKSAGVAAMLALAWTSAVEATTYRVSVDSPTVVSDPMQASALEPLDVGTNLSSLYHVTLQLSGAHTNGWWVGDGIESHFNGPMGAILNIYVFLGKGVYSPGLQSGGWYEGSATYSNDGPISTDLTLLPREPYLLELPYVADDQVALCLVRWPIIGFGHMELFPFLRVDRANIQLDDSPAIELALNPANGVLTLSGVPASGSLEVLSAIDPAGPWQIERRVPAQDGPLALDWPPAQGSRFFRVRWSDTDLPSWRNESSTLPLRPAARLRF